MPEYFANSPHELSLYVNHTITMKGGIAGDFQFIALEKVRNIDNNNEYDVTLRFYTKDKETGEIGDEIAGNELYFGMPEEELNRFVEIAINGQDASKRIRGEYDIFTVKAFNEAYRMNEFLEG